MARARALRPVDVAAVALIGAVIAGYIIYGLVTASRSFGCDFLAYYNASINWLTGHPIYDLSVASTGTCGTYQYPPPFVLVAAPFSIFGFTAGTWAWVTMLLAAWLTGTAILPVNASVKLTVLFLSGIGWPLLYGVRIGQVTPLLYLVFAIAWRSLERPMWLGGSVAVGAMLKLQPGLLGLWLLARRDWKALAAAAVVGLAIVAVAALLGLADWIGLLTLLRSLSNAVDIDVNMAIGATLHGLGLTGELARAVQAVNTVAMLALVVFAGIRLPRTAGFLVAVIASQLISPIVWSHYALILILPVAWLLQRRQWWATLIPLVHIWVLLPFVPNWTYAVAFHAALIGVIVVGLREGPTAEPGADPAVLRPMPEPAT